MSERRVLTENEAFGMLAHFFSTADLHNDEGPYYSDRRIAEGTQPLIDAMIRDGHPASTAWLETLKSDLQSALAERERNRQAYEDFLHQVPGRIATEIKRRNDV